MTTRWIKFQAPAELPLLACLWRMLRSVFVSGVILTVPSLFSLSSLPLRGYRRDDKRWCNRGLSFRRGFNLNFMPCLTLRATKGITLWILTIEYFAGTIFFFFVMEIWLEIGSNYFSNRQLLFVLVLVLVHRESDSFVWICMKFECRYIFAECKNGQIK